MTPSQALFVAAILLTGAFAALWWVCRRPRPDLSQTLAERIDWSEADVQQSHGVPWLYVDTVSGGHDDYPHLSEQARQGCIGGLEQVWSLPAAERAS